MHVPLQSISGIPDNVLLWRVIVRKTYEVIQEHINPTTVACSVLSGEDANQIAQAEQTEGRLEAVNLLINKLIKLNDTRWTRLFPISLEKQHPKVFVAVAKAKEDILKEEWAVKTIGTK